MFNLVIFIDSDYANHAILKFTSREDAVKYVNDNQIQYYYIGKAND